VPGFLFSPAGILLGSFEKKKPSRGGFSPFFFFWKKEMPFLQEVYCQRSIVFSFLQSMILSLPPNQLFSLSPPGLLPPIKKRTFFSPHQRTDPLLSLPKVLFSPSTSFPSPPLSVTLSFQRTCSLSGRPPPPDL